MIFIDKSISHYDPICENSAHHVSVGEVSYWASYGIYTHMSHLFWSLEITLLLTLYILDVFISSCFVCPLPASQQKCRTLLNSHCRLFYWMCPIQNCKWCATLLSSFLFPRGKQNIYWKIHFCNCKEHRSFHHDITTYREETKYGGITIRRPYTSKWNNQRHETLNQYWYGSQTYIYRV